MPVVNKIWFCVFRRASSRKVVCFCISLAFKAFISLFIIITLTSLVNCRNEEQKLHKAMCRKLWGKRVRLQFPKTEKWRPYKQTPHATEPQIHRIVLSHPLQISHIQPWLNGYWAMLISETDSLMLRVKSSRNYYFYKFWYLYPIRERGAKGEKRIREAWTKEQRQFPMRD